MVPVGLPDSTNSIRRLRNNHSRLPLPASVPPVPATSRSWVSPLHGHRFRWGLRNQRVEGSLPLGELKPENSSTQPNQLFPTLHFLTCIVFVTSVSKSFQTLSLPKLMMVSYFAAKNAESNPRTFAKLKRKKTGRISMSIACMRISISIFLYHLILWHSMNSD